MGKTRVMDSFYQYSDFITGGVKAPGILTDISANGEGFLSFLRLVGCFYFKKHKAPSLILLHIIYTVNVRALE